MPSPARAASSSEMAEKSITIKDIKVFAHHGVLPEERARGQEFLIDVEIELEEGMADTDDLPATVDYAEAAGAVASIATSQRYDLIETLAAAIVDHLLSLEGVRSTAVTVKKPNAPLPVEAGWVGVTVRSDKHGR
jgi:dihydroneopterin aldolase